MNTLGAWSKDWRQVSNAPGTCEEAPGSTLVPWIVLGHDFYNKHLHPIYKTCVFPLDVWTQL